MELGGLSPWQLLRNVIDEMIANRLFGRAAKLAFYFLFALFALILVMTTLFGLFTTQRIDLQNHSGVATLERRLTACGMSELG